MLRHKKYFNKTDLTKKDGCIIMLCEKCKQNPATVHLTNISGGAVREYYLCEKCAKSEEFSPVLNNFDIFALFGDNSDEKETVCPVCRTTLSEFEKTGIAGCPQCYDVFLPVVEKMSERIHGRKKHITENEEKSVDSLKNQLKEAVEKEEYEKAAYLRDEIKKLSGGEDK